MKLLKIIFILVISLAASCQQVKSDVSADTFSDTDAAKTVSVSKGNTIKIYGLIKAERTNVYIITNWQSRSKVTYTITGPKKDEIAANAGKYISVLGTLTENKRWSGTIEVTRIISIDKKPAGIKKRTLNTKKK
ncbi:MAG TPA: hypothetical protein PK358_17175 [Spirochaetota bacterium]|nr:hypothetical protein [Spirochaetota bacterium]HPJ36574.1 hypothetical protein [Spirochaetota bacterium]